MLRSKKGFTLVELLAVIVILAIILAIAVPGISGIISSAKRGAFESDAKMIVAGIEYKVLEHSVDSEADLPDVDADILDELASYGADRTNYTTACIKNMSPITVCLTSASGSEFGVITGTATRTTVSVAACTCP